MRPFFHPDREDPLSLVSLGRAEELILILDVAESTAPGTKKVVHKLSVVPFHPCVESPRLIITLNCSYEKLERSTQKALLSLSFQGYF